MTPAVRRIVKENSIDLAHITPTGKQRKRQLPHPAPPYNPVPRGQGYARGNVWGLNLG